MHAHEQHITVCVVFGLDLEARQRLDALLDLLGDEVGVCLRVGEPNGLVRVVVDAECERAPCRVGGAHGLQPALGLGALDGHLVVAVGCFGYEL